MTKRSRRRMIWHLPPPLLPTIVSKLDRRHIERLRKTDNLPTVWVEIVWRGWRRSEIIRQRESLIFYKTFNTFWFWTFVGFWQERLDSFDTLVILLDGSVVKYLNFQVKEIGARLFNRYGIETGDTQILGRTRKFYVRTYSLIKADDRYSYNLGF